MKKNAFPTFYFLLLNFVAFGQSNFNIGFKDGFKNGYCYSNNQSSYYCMPPLPPLPPLPQINESRNSYQDGYNQGMWFGQNQRKKDEYNSSNSAVNSNPPKFNPYVSQSPILNSTPQERAVYYANRARQDQEVAEAFGNLLGNIFTVTPEGKARRAERKAKRWEEYKKKHKIKIEKTIDKIDEFTYSEKVYTGKQPVYSYSPIFDRPNVGQTAIQIGTTEMNKTVFILEKSKGRYYKVSSSDIIGYMSSVWFKNEDN